MSKPRIGTLGGILLFAALACSNDTAPSTDGAPFMDLKVDGATWTVTGTSLSLTGDQLHIGGTHQVPNSNLSYSITVSAKPFTGAGSYALTGPYGNQTVTFLAIDTVSAGPSPTDYVTNADDPGTLDITEYRASDSTGVGSFHVTLHGATAPDSVLTVVGSFRARAP